MPPPPVLGEGGDSRGNEFCFFLRFVSAKWGNFRGFHYVMQKQQCNENNRLGMGLAGLVPNGCPHRTELLAVVYLMKCQSPLFVGTEAVVGGGGFTNDLHNNQVHSGYIMILL